ncbi:hypothetical protein ACOMHN_039553 [Nucella lapillus]
MKIWTSEHTFEHRWDTVVKAAWRKYPNPHNPVVVGLDVVDRKVDKKGILHSHRLLSTAWSLPGWATRLIGIDQMCYASEHSEVDPQKKIFTLKTRNLTFCNYVTVDEVLIYSPHPEDSSKTTLQQEAVVSVKGMPLCSKMESIMTDTISKNAGKGRMAMEWVINMLKTEAQDLSAEAKKLSNDLTLEAQKLTSEANKLSTEAKKHIDSVLPSPSPASSTL